MCDSRAGCYVCQQVGREAGVHSITQTPARPALPLTCLYCSHMDCHSLYCRCQFCHSNCWYRASSAAGTLTQPPSGLEPAAATSTGSAGCGSAPGEGWQAQAAAKSIGGGAGGDGGGGGRVAEAAGAAPAMWVVGGAASEAGAAACWPAEKSPSDG